MSTILNYKGRNDDSFYPWGCSSQFLSLDHQFRDSISCFRPCKRSRVVAPLVYDQEKFEDINTVSIEVLPDECLFEIFTRLPGGDQEIKSACAGVSKRWLHILSSSINIVRRDVVCSDAAAAAATSECQDDGFLSRCLEGKKATDNRLAAIAVGSSTSTSRGGGLSKLSIRGSNRTSDSGIKTIARASPSLKVLSLWDVPSVGDEGLAEIANRCPLLERLDISHCPGITDKALITIAKRCRNLTVLRIVSCPNIGNESFKAFGSYSLNLKSVAIEDCPLVGDQGIACLFSAETQALTKVKLQLLNISDLSLAVIGHYGKMITDLHLSNLRAVNEKGFWVMGNCQGLQMLKSLTIESCQGVTDLGLAAIGKGCPNLKQLCLSKCALLSDNGLVSFSQAAGALESLKLEECHRITEGGLFGSVFNSCGNLKALFVSKCFGIKDASFGSDAKFAGESLQSLSIQNCPGFGDLCLTAFSRLCTELHHLSLKDLKGVTDAGFLAFLKSCETGLVKANLSGCVNLTDESVSSMMKSSGSTLEILKLDGCNKITDASLSAIANNCIFLSELDLSSAAITDYGLAILAGAKQLNLQILSLAGCSSISNKSIPSLVRIGRTLIGLNIQRCNAICSNKVDKLVEQLWRCDILY